jgi:hypothetical protein
VTGIGRLERVVLDAEDAAALAGFYAELTGWPVEPVAAPALTHPMSESRAVPSWP